MKKTVTLFLVGMMILTLFGCGNKQGSSESKENETSKYTTSLEVLQAVLEVYKEEDLFAIYGGNQENAIMDAPGTFDISKTEELENTLGLPESQISNIDDAASMVHMMNANTFTSAAYHLKEGIDINNFADTAKSNILGKTWMCGQPDTLLIINVDGSYVITAYGEVEIMETFKTNVLSAISSAKVIVEVSIA